MRAWQLRVNIVLFLVWPNLDTEPKNEKLYIYLNKESLKN